VNFTEEMMNDLLDYAEKAGAENLKFRLQNAETLAKEANSVLTILLAGIGGSMALAAKGFEQAPGLPSAMTVGVMCLSAWLTISAAMLVVFCMLSMDLPVPTNEPLNLYRPEFELDKIRVAELRNLDGRIKQATARNHRVAAWLDRIRLLAVASPIFFLLTSLAWAALAPDLSALAPVAG
jgi:hypothetical protein